MRALLLSCCALGALSCLINSPLSGQGSPSAEASPVVVAVDTSRSLNAAQLDEIVQRLRLALADLDDSTPTGLLAFDDQPRWILEPTATPEAVGQALQTLTPQGDFTLLNDALFGATRALDGGGIILLATDGRDENSATTVEDIARRCEAQGIRILSLGSGRNVQQRFLRRLALLTGGDYLGEVTRTDASTIAGALRRAAQELTVANGRGPSSDPRTSTPSSPSPSSSAASSTATSAATDPPSAADGATERPRTADGPSGRKAPWYASPLWVGLVVALLALLAFLLGRRVASSPAPTPYDDVFDDTPPDLHESTQTPAVDSATEARLVAFPMASMDEAPEVTVDTAVFYGSSLEDRLEKTRVLTDRGVLISRRADDSPRLYLLSFDKAFGVGRSRDDNTLAIPDPALSAQHFRVVPDGGDYYVLDMGSTNGSYLNGQPVKSCKLASGDTIRAGQGEFEFQSQGGALGA